MIKQKKLDIPAQVSGRQVTNRGVHLQPFGYHGTLLDNSAYWVDLLVSMGISWVVLITEGDSVLEERHGINPLKLLLDAGIIPIIRDKRQFPKGFINTETVRRSVAVYEHYGLRPFWQLYNEPFDEREWIDKKVPVDDEAWQIIASRWTEGASQVVKAGAYVGFPDGPGYTANPFEQLRSVGGLGFFDAGVAFYAPHSYGKGRPLWYPYDAVTRHGASLSEQAYRQVLDEYEDDPAWSDAPVDLLNEARREWADPTRTAIIDDTCWRSWEKIVYFAIESLGYVPPMAMTEGGWTPRDRAGTGPVDIRWPYTTPQMVAKKTLHMYDTPSPFFAICPWLLADRDLGGADGWAFDAWHGWAYNEKYGEEKPVITRLKEVAPKEIQPRSEPMVIDVDSDVRDWAWIHQAYGAGYRRGITSLRLIEVHEYEGPAALDVLVVDEDGLPLEGVEFFYYHPEVPEKLVGEWYGQGMPAATGGDGRLSFAPKGLPCTPGTCNGAIWPKDKGDVLEGLGLLSGTRNRHLNGVWQRVQEGTAPLPPATPPKIAEDSKAEPKSGPSTKPTLPTGPTAKGEPNVDVRIRPLITLDLTGDTYKLVDVTWMDPIQSNGLHHIFFDLVDHQGKRLVGEKVRVSWSGDEQIVTIEEKPGEPWAGNFPMYATLGSYTVRAVPISGTSDAAAGLGMGTPQQPKTELLTSFGLRFVKQAPGAHPPSTEPGKQPGTTPGGEPGGTPGHPTGPVAAGEPKIDPRIRSLITLDLTGDTYKLEEVIWMDPAESGGLHHIFVDLVDRQGKRLAGENVRVSWSDGENIVAIEEKPGEPWAGNFPMYATLGSYTVHMVPISGTSDGVAGLGMGTPEQPQMKHHTSFGLKFLKLTS